MIQPAYLVPVSASSGRGKNDQILAGCRRLQSTQSEGQSFTPTEIGAACGVTERAITFIERNALKNFACRLHAAAPKLFEELLLNRSITEVFTKVTKDPYRSGRPSGANRRKLGPKPAKPDHAIPGLCAVAKTFTRPERDWRNKKFEAADV